MLKKLLLTIVLVTSIIFPSLIHADENTGSWIKGSQGTSEIQKQYLDIQFYQPSQGDYIVADTENAIGYIINDTNNTYTSFELLSGQRRYVCYIGRCYNATTPERTWYIKEKNIKGNRYTFGPTGEFLRLYYEDKSTPYGIHSHKAIDYMMNNGSKFRSMGCILVRDNVHDVIEQSYTANSNNLKITTTTSFDSGLLAKSYPDVPPYSL